MVAARTFPPGFLWGAATSAHQVEGHCTNNQWWAWEREGGHIRDGTVSGLACDHYRRFEADFQLAARLRHTAQRISLEWSRVEPTEGAFDEAEFDHYRAVCDSIRHHGMAPTVTLHHFTNPIWAQRQGGWENPRTIDWLARFAERAGRALGDRVALWWTINEPMVAPLIGYLFGIHPPCVRDLARALVVSRHVLQAHGAMYQALKQTLPGATVGVVHNMAYFEPFDPQDPADRREAERQDYFANQWYLDGITQGRIHAPVGDGEEDARLRDSFDVLGLNYYMRILVRPGAPEAGMTALRRPGEREWFTDEMGWEVHPPGLGAHLGRLAALGKPLYVTENGHATLDEDARVRYLRAHLGQVHAAIAAGADVRGYFYWSLLDNFEWAEGYARHFGLIAVDPGTLARQPRPAALFYRDVIVENALPAD